jgi:ATP synthase protein I
MSQTPDDLGQKIRDAQKKQEPSPRLNNALSGESGKALRMGTDFIISVVIGVFLGYWIDRWLGTKPFGIIIFLFLGFGAGVVNMQRLETASTREDKKDDKDKKQEV